MLQLTAYAGHCLVGPVETGTKAYESVKHAWQAVERYGNAGSRQTLCQRQTLITQNVALRKQYVSGGQSGQIRCQGR